MLGLSSKGNDLTCTYAVHQLLFIANSPERDLGRWRYLDHRGANRRDHHRLPPVHPHHLP